LFLSLRVYNAFKLANHHYQAKRLYNLAICFNAMSLLRCVYLVGIFSPHKGHTFFNIK